LTDLLDQEEDRASNDGDADQSDDGKGGAHGSFALQESVNSASIHGIIQAAVKGSRGSRSGASSSIPVSGQGVTGDANSGTEVEIGCGDLIVRNISIGRG
jgi:hypothetical protein